MNSVARSAGLIYLGMDTSKAALTSTYGHYRAMLLARDAELTAIESDLTYWHDHGPFADAVTRLGAYRGVAYMGALTIASEVGDWRRFATAGAFMGFTGLCPSEYSSGNTVHRGHITKAGNAHLRTQLIESAWQYQHRPSIGVTIARRHKDLPRPRWPGPGPPSSACAVASAAWTPARPAATWSWSRSPASWPGSCGLR